MSKDKMREVACLMLVDLAAHGVDVRNMSSNLVNAYAFGTEEQFRTACTKVGTAYKTI